MSLSPRLSVSREALYRTGELEDEAKIALAYHNEYAQKVNCAALSMGGKTSRPANPPAFVLHFPPRHLYLRSSYIHPYSQMEASLSKEASETTGVTELRIQLNRLQARLRGKGAQSAISYPVDAGSCEDIRRPVCRPPS